MTPPKTRIDLVRRPAPEPQRSLPFGARSVSIARFAPGVYEDRHVRPFAKVMWCVSGVARVSFGGPERAFRPGQVAVYFPDTPHVARAGEEPWRVCWWTMDGPLVAEVMVAFGPSSEGVYDAGPAPVDRVRELHAAIRDVTPRGEVRAGAIVFELLGLATHSPRRQRADVLVTEATKLMDAAWHDSSFGVETLARRLGVHRSVLARRFAARVGLTPIQYLSNVRMQHALTLLRQTGAPIGEIARRCGYEDPSYFARLFRKTQGMTPRQWRGE